MAIVLVLSVAHSLTVFWCLVSRVSLLVGKTGNELCEIGQI